MPGDTPAGAASQSREGRDVWPRYLYRRGAKAACPPDLREPCGVPIIRHSRPRLRRCRGEWCARALGPATGGGGSPGFAAWRLLLRVWCISRCAQGAGVRARSAPERVTRFDAFAVPVADESPLASAREHSQGLGPELGRDASRAAGVQLRFACAALEHWRRPSPPLTQIAGAAYGGRGRAAARNRRRQRAGGLQRAFARAARRAPLTRGRSPASRAAHTPFGRDARRSARATAENCARAGRHPRFGLIRRDAAAHGCVFASARAAEAALTCSPRAALLDGTENNGMLPPVAEPADRSAAAVAQHQVALLRHEIRHVASFAHHTTCVAHTAAALQVHHPEQVCSACAAARSRAAGVAGGTPVE